MPFLMGKISIYALILLTSLLASGGVKAGGDSLHFQRSYALEQPIQYFTVDNLGAYYLITRRNELIKYDEKGQWVGNHREQVLGQLRHVDVFNPLQLLLFYPEVSVLLQLDNMLYQTNRFEVAGLQLSNQSQVCRSFDNNFWMYDERSFRLRKLAFDMRTVLEGEWLQNEISGQLAPTYMLEHNERVYLTDPKLGMLVFDLYGRYLKTIPVNGIERMDFWGEHAYFARDGQVWRLHLREGTAEALNIGKHKAKMVRVNQRGLYVWAGNELLQFAHPAKR
jgi:hypothetical protein